jgi:DNA-binding transcriptional LysR family regulator
MIMEDRLRKFAHLVDAGSFTRAAQELHISQPALSTAIAKLERELKNHLFVHGARPLALTAAGQLAYQAAKDLAVQTDNLKLRLAELGNEKLSLKIGMIDSVADALFADGHGLEMLEQAQVSVTVNNSRYLTEAIERGTLDIAFIAEQSRRLPALLETRPVGVEPLVRVAHTDRPDLPSRKLPDFISYDQPSNTFRLVQRALRDFGVTPVTTFYSTSPEVMLRLAVLNKGVAALPYLMVREYIASGKLKRLGDKSWLIERPIVVLQRRDKELPLALTELTHQTTVALSALMDEAQFAA